MTYRALLGYSLGLVFYALSISLVRIFNARHDMKTPAVIGLTSIVLNAFLAYLLMLPLKNFGIALATSAVSFYNFCLLYLLYSRRTQYRPSSRASREIVRSLISGAIVVFLLWLMRELLVGMPYTFFALAIVVTVGVYALFFRKYYVPFLQRRRERA